MPPLFTKIRVNQADTPEVHRDRDDGPWCSWCAASCGKCCAGSSRSAPASESVCMKQMGQPQRGEHPSTGPRGQQEQQVRASDAGRHEGKARSNRRGMEAKRRTTASGGRPPADTQRRKAQRTTRAVAHTHRLKANGMNERTIMPMTSAMSTADMAASTEYLQTGTRKQSGICLQGAPTRPARGRQGFECK